MRHGNLVLERLEDRMLLSGVSPDAALEFDAMGAEQSEPVDASTGDSLDGAFTNASDGETVVQVELGLVDLDGTEGIKLGESFQVEVEFIDVRDPADPQGVWSGYADVEFAPSLLEADALTHSDSFTIFRTGTIDNPSGLVDEAGAVSSSMSAHDNLLVFTLDMTAEGPGVVTVSTNAGESEMSDITIFGADGDQSANTDFGTLEIQLGEAPSDISMDSSQVPENQTAGTAVGAFTTTDPDVGAGDAFTYELITGEGDADNASFIIDGGVLKTAESFDHEAKDSYSIRVSSTDLAGYTTEKQFDIGVTDVNEAPTDVGLEPTSVEENEPVGTVVGSFTTTDPDAGESFTYDLMPGEGDADNGSFLIDGNTLTTAETFDFESADTYSIRVRSTDSGEEWVERQFTVTVDDVNEPPTGSDDGDATDEDTAFTTINVLENDTDPDPADVLSVSGLDTTGTAGSVTDNGNGTFDYDPNGEFEHLAAGESATDTFSYTVSDGNGGTDSATVTVTIEGVNDAPTANDDVDATDEDTSVTTVNVLTNDTDPDTSDTLSVMGMDDSATAGSVTNNGDGTFLYDPNGAFEHLADGETATDTFTYTMSDGNPGTITATVTITIEGVNDAPLATDDEDTTDEDTSVTTVNVLDNDTDPDASDTLVVQDLDTTGTAGVVSDNGDGTFAYDPNGEFDHLASGETATDTFSYTVTDGNGGTDGGTVTVTIEGVNDSPTATDDEEVTDEDTAFTTGNVLSNDTDPDTSDTVSLTGFDASSTAGSVSSNGDGTFVYDPDGQFEHLAVGETATDTFSYTVGDGNGGTDSGTVTVTVEGVNDAPTATDDEDSTDADTAFTTGNVLNNDTDPDGSDTLLVSALDNTGTIGTVTDNTDGTFVYDPNGQFEDLAEGETTTDTFTYTVSDGNGGTDTATVTVTIEGVNDSPTANDDQDSTDEDTAFTTGNVLTNDTDPDTSDSLSVSGLDTSATAGSVSSNGDGTFAYDPDGQFEDLAAGETATDTFIYTVGDGNGGTDTGTVTVTIEGVNDAPTGIALDPAEVEENQASGAQVGDLTTEDVDQDAGFDYELVAGAGDENNASFTIDGTSVVTTESFDYESDSAYSVRVRSTDSAGDSVERQLTISVLNVVENDFVPTAAAAVQDHVLNGEFDFEYSVQNLGPDASGAFSADIVLSQDEVIGNEDDVVVDTLELAGLGAGEEISGTHATVLDKESLYDRAVEDDPPGGGTTYESTSAEWVGLVVDPEDLVEETNETNNVSQDKDVGKDDVTYFPWDIDGSGMVTPTDAIFVINRLGDTDPDMNPLADLDGSGGVAPTDAIGVINRLGYRINPAVVEVTGGSSVQNTTSETFSRVPVTSSGDDARQAHVAELEIRRSAEQDMARVSVQAPVETGDAGSDASGFSSLSSSMGDGELNLDWPSGTEEDGADELLPTVPVE